MTLKIDNLIGTDEKKNQLLYIVKERDSQILKFNSMTQFYNLPDIKEIMNLASFVKLYQVVNPFGGSWTLYAECTDGRIQLGGLAEKIDSLPVKIQETINGKSVVKDE